MRTLHVVPGDSAGGSLRHAIRDVGRDEEVLPFRDDLSCGPIEPGDPSARATWWERFHEASEVEGELRAFWNRIATTDDRLVVWFGRYTAQELAFLLAWADRLGERSYDVVDVTGLRLPFSRRDDSLALSQPAPGVSSVPTDGLRSLLGSERPVAIHETEECRQQWQRLRKENAPFRVVTAMGLVSAPVDHFDPLLLERATPEWRKVSYILHETIWYNSEPYKQVGDVMLLTRVVALVEEGKLLADGAPWDMRSCRVRLPT
jgi:hypothetical protein